MTWPHNTEVSTIQGGDSGGAKASATATTEASVSPQSEVRICGHQVANTNPIVMFEVLHEETAGGDEAKSVASARGPSWRSSRCSFRDDHWGGRERSGVSLEKVLAISMVGVVCVCGGHQWAGVDQHSVAPEPLGQNLVGLRRGPVLTGSSNSHEFQMPAGAILGWIAGKSIFESGSSQLVHGDSAPSRLGDQTVDQLIGQVHRGHDIKGTDRSEQRGPPDKA